MKLHYKAGEGETINYVDVMSLYPYTRNYFKFTLDHPVIHVGAACKDKEARLRKDGLIKCSIVRPERLQHPMHPSRSNQKIIFRQCRTCVLTSSTGEC